MYSSWCTSWGESAMTDTFCPISSFFVYPNMLQSWVLQLVMIPSSPMVTVPVSSWDYHVTDPWFNWEGECGVVLTLNFSMSPQKIFWSPTFNSVTQIRMGKICPSLRKPSTTLLRPIIWISAGHQLAQRRNLWGFLPHLALPSATIILDKRIVLLFVRRW